MKLENLTPAAQRRAEMRFYLHAIFSPESQISLMDLLDLSNKLRIYGSEGLILPEDVQLLRGAISAKDRYHLYK